MARDVDTGTDTVRSWVDDGVAVIELNRPERRNALHADMFDAIPQLIETFDIDDEVGVYLLTAAGSAFCAGGDVRDGGRRPTDSEEGRLLRMAAMVLMLHESPKISIGALPGPAVGAGIGLALCTDLRIAAASASFIPGWGRLAFSGDFGGPYFLTRLLGPVRALEVLVDGSTIDAQQALDSGLVNRVVPDAALREDALAWAKRIASGPRTAHRFMKENVRDAQDRTLRQALPDESDRMTRSGRTEEHRQAVRRWMAEAKAKAKRGG